MKSLLRKSLYLAYRLGTRPPAPPTETEREHWRQLISEVQGAAMPARASVHDEWDKNLATLRDHVLNDDPRAFLQWDVVRQTMFVTFAPYVLRELAYLRGRDWRDRWKEAIRESAIGRPFRYPLYPASSGNLIHYAYHLARFIERSATDVARLSTIVEFGGGYGGMCRLLHRIGFNGRYIILDLPYFSALQRYYLRSHELPVTSAAAVSRSETGIACVSDLAELRLLVDTIENPRHALFLATWSLSEVPYELRAQVLPLSAKISHFLIAYQGRFGELDNRDFFSRWIRSRPDVDWVELPIPHLPDNCYAFGYPPRHDDQMARAEAEKACR